MRRSVVALVALALLLCASSQSAQAQAQVQPTGRWLRAESANFIIYSTLSEGRLRRITQALEDFDATLRALTNTNAPPSENKLELYLMRNISGLREVFPGVSSGLGGAYSTSSEYITASLVYTDFDGDLGEHEILFHEYAHHFMLHYFPNAYPRWYTEGWAEFVSTIEVEDRRATVGTPSASRSRSILQLGLLPIEELLAPERVARRDAIFTGRFYAHAWIAASYIANRPSRQEGLARYVAALSQGSDPIEAFQPAFGVTPLDFGRELREYMRGVTSRLAVRLAETPAELTITRLPRSADALLLDVVRIRIDNVRSGERAALAREIEREAAAFPDDPFARKAAVRAALLRDDFALARTRAEPIVAAYPSDGEAHYLLGLAYMGEANAESTGPEARDTALRAARRILAQGFRADANYFPTLFLYVRTFAGGPEPLTEAQLEVLARAMELAPQAEDIRLLLAEELMRARQFDTAIIVLGPIMYSPHDEVLSDRVRVMVEAARRGEAPPPWNRELAEAAAEGEQD